MQGCRCEVGSYSFLHPIFLTCLNKWRLKFCKNPNLKLRERLTLFNLLEVTVLVKDGKSLLCDCLIDMKSYEVTDLCFFFSARMAKSATISVFSSSFATVALVATFHPDHFQWSSGSKWCAFHCPGLLTRCYTTGFVACQCLPATWLENSNFGRMGRERERVERERQRQRIS